MKKLICSKDTVNEADSRHDFISAPPSIDASRETGDYPLELTFVIAPRRGSPSRSPSHAHGRRPNGRRRTPGAGGKRSRIGMFVGVGGAKGGGGREP